MKEIKSRTYHIKELLISIFPHDICKIIINIMLQIEFNDSKEEHKKNCFYFNIQNRIGINLSSIKPPSPYHYRFSGELWRHIDRDNKNGQINHLIKGLSHAKFANYVEDHVFQGMNFGINFRSGNKILNNLKILKNLNRFKRHDGACEIIMHYGHYLTLQGNEASYYHYDNITGFNKSNQYVSLKKLHHDMKNIFYIHDNHDERVWQDLCMIIVNNDQISMNNRKTSRNKIFGLPI